MRKYTIVLVFIVALLVLGACNSNAIESDTSMDEQAEENNEILTIEHELGTAEIEKNPEKVVVFDFGMLDTLDFLGVDVTAVPQMNIPSYLDKYSNDEYENVGSLKEPDFEKINSIDPDLIIISSRQAELYDEFAKLGPVLYVGLDYDNYLESFKENTKIIGEIFEKEAEIEEVLSEIDEKITDVNVRSTDLDKEALIVLANESKISAYGEGSRFGIIHDVFGIPAVDENIEESTHGMNVAFEYVIEQNPDIIYVIDRGAAIGEEPSAKEVVENELIAKTSAMKNEDIYYLDPEIWYLAAGGVISIQQMIDEIAQSVE